MSYLEEFHRAYALERRQASDLRWRVKRFTSGLQSALAACAADDLMGAGLSATTCDVAEDGCAARLLSKTHVVTVDCRVGPARATSGPNTLVLHLSIAAQGAIPAEGPRLTLHFDEDEDVEAALVEVVRMLGVGLARAGTGK